MTLLTHAEVKEFFIFNEKTGVFTWRKRRGNIKPHSVAGTPRDNLYLQIQFNGRLYRAHRLAWFYVHGQFPPEGMEIDHINGDRADNRLVNLRLATRSQNMFNAKLLKNNTSGFRGVHKCARSGLWIATFKMNGKINFLGRFSSLKEAANIAANARKNAVPEFYREVSLGKVVE